MGQLNVDRLSVEARRAFTRSLLADVRALDRMLASDALESGCRRIGCEQEMFLVDRTWMANPVGPDLLESLEDGHFTTELGRFNLELNLDPITFGDDCLSRMESELHARLSKAREVAKAFDTEIVLTGILPSLRKSDLTLDNMTPRERYHALNDALGRLCGGDWQFHLEAADQLNVRQDSIMLEACCTSFQVHYQADAATFPQLYNAAQAITGPLLAAAANSPLLFGRRLWSETRIPLFQQAVDTRRATASLRERLPRVSFGSRWVERSAVELFQEDIARFPVLLGSQDSEDSLATLRRGEIPRLRALQAYNSTVYRWNRACYGITGGKPHLRIENRVLPAGPTVLDEVANAAFFFGMLRGMIAVYPDVTRLLSFEDVRKNFLSAARDGLDAQFQWINGKSISARSLIAGELVPMARAGLESGSIRRADIERYLGVIEARIPSGRSGAEWSLQSLANMKNTRRETALTTLTAAIAHRQWETPGPAHEWPLAGPAEKRTIKRNMLSIEEAMTTDLSTVHPDEPIDLVVNLMDWRRIRHVPVEDEDGRLAGLVSYFEVIRHLNQRASDSDPVAVRAIMNSNPLTVSPEARVQDAIALMSEKNAACLLVVKDSRLVGIVTEHDVLRLTAELLR